MTIYGTVVDAQNQPVPLADCDIAFHIAAPVPIIKSASQNTITISGNNTFTLVLSPAETVSLLGNATQATFLYEIAIRTADGAVIRVSDGLLTVKRSRVTSHV